METATDLFKRKGNKQILMLLGVFLLGLSNIVKAQPDITSLTPLSGGAGTQVTINGINFNATPDNNIVYFGATKAVVVSATATRLIVTVPSGATYMPVSVTNSVTGLTGYSPHPFIPTFACGEAIKSSSFATPLIFATQDKPYNVNSGDLDGDGKADLAVVNYISNTVSLYRNSSIGGALSFEIPIVLTTENGPTCVAIGDLNGDGKPDLSIVNYNANSVSVYKNTSTSGLFSFDPKTDYPTGVTPLNAIIVDLDEDGKPELAVTNGSSSSNTISIYKNISTNGSVSFDPKVDFATGNIPIGIASGDINNDGKPDIVISNYFSNTISVFNNTSSTGNISFAARADFPSGPYPLDVAVGDINADSKPDVVVTNYADNFISVYKNNGSTGTISFSPYVTYPTGSGPWGVYISDLNGDGKPDMAAASLWSAGVSVYENNSSSSTVSYAAAIDFSAGATSREISIADYNADGKPDMAIVNYDENTVGIYENKNGGFAPAAAGPISGLSDVCQGQSSVLYSVPVIENADSYIWTLPPGALGNSTTNSITVNYENNAGTGSITVAGTKSCGKGVTSSIEVLVNQKPATPDIVNNGNNILQSGSIEGNQWFNQSGIIQGATDQNYTVTENGSYYVVVTLKDCSSEPSNTIQIINTGLESDLENKIILYPNPVTDAFTIESEEISKRIEFEVFNSLGQIVSTGSFISKTNIETDLLQPGIYMVKITTDKMTKKIKVIKK